MTLGEQREEYSVSITIGGYTFDGPHKGTDKLEDRSGIYAILCYREEKYFVVDVGESATIKTRVEGHDRKECWKRNCTGTLMVAVLYTPNRQQVGRMEIEQTIRDKYDPPCGKR